MKPLFFHKKREFFLVLVIAVFVTVISTNYFAQAIRKPPHSVFIGMSHYFEDFYYYLDQFDQGANGGWWTVNRFTSENLAPTLIYFGNILLGKIGGIFGLKSFVTYNWSLVILKPLFFLISYWVLWQIFPGSFKYRFSAFLIYMFSTSFPFMYLGGKSLQSIEPQRIFRAENQFVSRFGNIPMTYIVNILFLIAFLLLIRFFIRIRRDLQEPVEFKKLISFINQKRTKVVVAMIAVFTFLVISEAMKAGILLVVFLLALWHFRPEKNTRNYFIVSLAVFFILSCIYLIISSYIVRTVDIDPVYKQGTDWDIDQFYKQASYLYIKNYFTSFGIISVTFITGIVVFLFRKNKSSLEKIVMEVSLICVLGYFLPLVFKLPIPGFRMIFSSTYIFVAAVSIYPLIYLEKRYGKKVIPVFLAIYLFINFLTISKSIINLTAAMKEPDYHFTYLPENIYKSLLFLHNSTSKDSIVMANPYSSVDLMLPGLAGRRTFTGHFLMTLNSSEKDRLVNAIYKMSLTPKQAKEILQQNNIRYLVNTIYDASPKELKAYYPFLKIIYENDKSTIFEIEN